MVYVHQPFPKVLYRKSKSTAVGAPPYDTVTVHSDEEHSAAVKAGFVATPAAFIEAPVDDVALELAKLADKKKADAELADKKLADAKLADAKQAEAHKK